ncbi:MAG: DUF4013 domain-containing protein [Methanobrevibacter sp.]|nr:DUF4013 domain-containing protein [Methanobrevibacter sp.]
MINEVKTNLKDAIRYPFLDLRIILIIGTVLFTISILNKLSLSNWESIIIILISHILIFLEMGYGTKIVYNGLLGEDRLPKFNKIFKLIWEGLKKYCIYIIYASIMSFLFKYAKAYFLADKIPLAIICSILFIFIYVLLIGSLLNRYENKGSFIKAFYYNEIYDLLKDIGAKDVLTILICAMIAQSFAISCFVDINPNTLSLIEIAYSVLTFFLAPITLISTKRLISLNLRRVYTEKEIKLK